MRKHRIPRVTLCAHALLLCIAAAGEAPSSFAPDREAQPAGPQNPAPAPEAVEARNRALLARNITRLAMMDLRAAEPPASADYDFASLLLSFAHDLVPDDEQILRRYIEAAYAAGDESLVLELTRRLLAPGMAPRDTVAQLRLITASVSRRNQTAEERLARYEEFLGPRGRTFDPSIRSRLALDAALLLRERGDERGFIEKLTLATQLDPSHKEAAALAATLIAESGQGPRATLEGLSLLLMADPADPNVHLAIARLLAAGDAFESSQRFHNNTLRIMQAAGNVPEDVLMEGRILRWHVDGPGALLRQINRELLVAQSNAARLIRTQQEAGRPVDTLRKPEEIRLPLHISTLAAVAARAADEATHTDDILRNMTSDAGRIVQTIEDAIRRGEVDQQQAARAVVSTVIQVQTARLWTGEQIENAARDLAANREIFEQASPDAYRILSAWLAIREGRPQEGLEALEPLADRDLLALLGMATAHEALGNPEQAGQIYLRVLREAPLEATGAWSRSRLLALGHQFDQSAAASLERLARTIPAAIDDMIINPRRYIHLTAQELDRSPDALTEQRIRIRIENASEYPLALGADRPINSRMLVAPKIELEGEAAEQLIRPEVIDLDRRLRLMPRESIDVEVWADPGSTGWLIELLANRTVRTRWRIVQGFVLDSDVGFRPGPMSQECETGAVVRSPLSATELPPDMLIARVMGDPPSELPRLAAAVRARLLQPIIAPAKRDLEDVLGADGRVASVRLRTQDMEALVPAIQAFATRYPQLSPVQRASIAAILPHAGMNPLVGDFDEVVRADTDPLVMAVTLATRISSPDDEYLSRARESGNPRLAALADAVAERLGSDVQYFSRTTIGGRAAPGDGESRR